MIKSIREFCDDLVLGFDAIAPDRQELLKRLSSYVLSYLEKHEPVRLVYVCTHNSRRSQFGQVWARVASEYFHVPGVLTFSGGTEATLFNANAIAAFRRLGFLVHQKSVTENPIFEVFHSDEMSPSICFSKVYDHQTNPSQSFAAIMTCSDAEANCPFIQGAEIRLSTTYDDPKLFDGTPLMESAYDGRCKQIARECLFVFKMVSGQLSRKEW